MHAEPNTISLDKGYQVRHWMRALGCTEGELYSAVQHVGKGLAELREYRQAMAKATTIEAYNATAHLHCPAKPDDI